MGELTAADKRRRLLVALLVIACIAGIGVAINSTREVDANGDVIADRGSPCEVVISGEDVDAPACDPSDETLGEIVEQLFPAADSEALQQVQVGIDLGNRYTGVLVVDGVEVPESQLVRQEALNQVFFSPGVDRVVEQWEPGRNCVRAIVWPIAEGRTESRNVDWCFEVT
jgi:hypothetical protein